MLDLQLKRDISRAFKAGLLKVKSVTSRGLEKRPVSNVLRHSTRHKRSYRVEFDNGYVVATEDHSLFEYDKGQVNTVLTANLKVGSPLAVVINGSLTSRPVTFLEELDPLVTSYDLTVPGPENFVLASGILAHNSYSIGGVSLDIEKSSKYESAYQAIKDQFDSQLERAKQTVKIVKGLQQPRFGIGIRSSFGPYQGAGVLSPQKFVGFVLPLALFLQSVLSGALGVL